MKRKAKIFYTELNDFWRKEEKLAWLAENPLSKIEFQRIEPDEKHNWINQTDNDFESLIPLRIKNSEEIEGQIFINSSLGISTNRDEWVFDNQIMNLQKKIEYFINEINKYIFKKDSKETIETNIKWSRDLRSKVDTLTKNLKFEKSKINSISYRPYISYLSYLDKFLIDRFTEKHIKFKSINNNSDNLFINYTDTNSGKPFMVLSTKLLADLHFVGAGAGTMILPLYTFDSENQKHENITDWGLNQFREHYDVKQQAETRPLGSVSETQDNTLLNGRVSALTDALQITKEDIFYYVYAVLHSPFYRAKYEQNLKREFPRIPFYNDFFQWRDWGARLMDLHINYEAQEPFALERTDLLPTANKKDKTPNLFDNCLKDNDVIASGVNPTKDEINNTVPARDESQIKDSSLSAKENTTGTPNGLHPLLLNSSVSPTSSDFVPKIKTKLKADKTQGIIEIDSKTTLSGIPALAWEYKLGNRSAIEWILDQYKEKTPQDATIRERFNTYKFADYKESVIDLLKRVTTVSVKTMEIVNMMPNE